MSSSRQKESLLQELSRILLDPNSSESQRRSARRALERLADSSTLVGVTRQALAGDDPQAVSEVFGLLAQKANLRDIEPLLVGFLYEASPDLRQQALRLLAEKGSPQMIPSLEGILAAAAEPDSIFGPEDVSAAEQARQSIAARSH